MQNLTNKVKTCHGYDIYELTDEENLDLFYKHRRNSYGTRASYYPDKTYYIFEQGENLAETDPILICRALPRAINFCRQFSRIPTNNRLSVEGLKNLPLKEWVWIECLRPFDFAEKTSAYYRKCYDYSHERSFCCGYPGLSFSFDYADYGTTWEAYKYRP